MTGAEESRRVVVIGAGVIGASVAARIAEGGSAVVLVSDGSIGSTPASRASFAWVNSHAKQPAGYRELNEDGRRVHTERSAAHRTPWYHQVGAEIDGIEYAEDGYVDTHVFLGAQLEALRAAGGALRANLPIGSLDDARELLGPVDALVVAAGAGTAALLGDTAYPRLTASAGDDGFLVRVDVGMHPIDRIRSIGGLQIRPDGPGRIAAQSLSVEAVLRRTGQIAAVTTVWPALNAEIEHALDWRIPEDAPVRVDHAIRPHAADGLPVIGRVTEDVYVALAHSGVTLAPLLAELIARDLRGDADPRLAPFRP